MDAFVVILAGMLLSNEFKNCFLSTIKDKIQKSADVSRCVKVTRMLCKGEMLIICDF